MNRQIRISCCLTSALTHHFFIAAEEELRSQNKAKNRQQRKKVTKAKKIDDDMDSDEEYVLKEKKKVLTKKVTGNGGKASQQKVLNPKPKADPKTENRTVVEKLIEDEKKKAPVYSLSDSDDDEDIGTGISLMDRLNKKTGKPMSDGLNVKSNAKKRPSPRAHTASEPKDLESFEVEDFEPGKCNVKPLNGHKASRFLTISFNSCSYPGTKESKNYHQKENGYPHEITENGPK